MYQNELYHYGVLGMKWGRRNGPKRGSVEYYRNKQSRALDKYNKSKTIIGKSINNKKAYKYETKARVNSLINKESGLLKTYDNVYGHGNLSAKQKSAANYYERKSQYALTKRGRLKAKSESFNNKSFADVNAKLHNSSSLKEYGKNYIDAISKTKIKTWSGRTTTNGKQFVDSLFTGGVLTAIQDRQYYKDHK